MESNQDPQSDRKIKEVEPPPKFPLDHNILFPNNDITKPNWPVLKDHLQKEGRLSKQDFIIILDQATQIFKKEENLFHIKDPVIVVGDIHGQYYDLVKIIDVAGAPGANRYLFLGDYVDRGSFSIEVIILLYALKINFPNMTHMLRGNHECRQMTAFFNFRQECLYKYDEDIYERLMESFDAMPINCILNGKFLAVHGGIGPDLKKIEDINKIYRFVEPPKNGLLCDLLWSDPVDTEDGKLPEIYKFNDVRGCSYFFGAEAVVKFLKSNELLSVIRAHEAQLDGYKMYN